MSPPSVIPAKVGMTEGIHGNDKGRSHTETRIDAEVIEGRMGNPITTSSGQYILEVVGLGQCPEIEISKEKFLELKSAKRTLREAFACEEKYEIVIHNYIELEKELSGLTIADIGRSRSGYSDFFNYELTSNIKTANLLSSARLYTDSLPKNISTCLQDRNSIKQIKGFLGEEYKNNLYYRFISVLRNHVQHNNLPTHRISIGKRRTEDKLLEHYSNFSVEKKILLKDKRINKRIEREVLDEMKEEIDLILAIRHYIESISKIHIQARELVKSKVTEARDSIESAINKYKGVDTIDKESPGGLSVINRSKENEIIEEFSVSLDRDNIRLNLIKKNNRQLTNLHKKYATTQTNLGKNKH